MLVCGEVVVVLHFLCTVVACLVLVLLKLTLVLFVVGSICKDPVLAELVFAFLCDLVSRKLWVPHYRLLSTVTMNFGRVGRDLAYEDVDVVVLSAASRHLNVAKGRPSIVVEKKVELLLRLLVSWSSTGSIKREELEVLLQLVVSLCSHSEWRSGRVGELGVRCLVKLFGQAGAVHLEGLLGRLRAYCVMC